MTRAPTSCVGPHTWYRPDHVETFCSECGDIRKPWHGDGLPMRPSEPLDIPGPAFRPAYGTGEDDRDRSAYSKTFAARSEELAAELRQMTADMEAVVGDFNADRRRSES